MSIEHNFLGTPKYYLRVPKIVNKINLTVEACEL